MTKSELLVVCWRTVPSAKNVTGMMVIQQRVPDYTTHNVQKKNVDTRHHHESPAQP